MDCDVYRSWGCNTVYIPHPVTFKIEQKNNLTNKIAINVGRYTSDKRQELLIECWSRIENRDGWVLWIVGEGEEKDRLKCLIKELEASDNVFLKPATKDIKEIYKEASLFILTSRMEGFGMVLLEAMSFGIPCISFDCPSGPRDVIKDGYNGLLVEDGNTGSLMTSVKEFFAMKPDERHLMGENAFRTAGTWGGSVTSDWNNVFR